MTAPIVPSEAPAEDVGPEPFVPHRPSRRRWWLAGAGVVAVLGVALAAFLVPLPYYVVQPGSVRPADQRIEVTGIESFDDDGQLYFTTVYIHRATAALLVRSWLDDAFEVRTEEEVYPDGDREGVRQMNVLRMDNSKLLATKVALDELGIEAEWDSDGVRVVDLAETSPSAQLLEVGDVITSVGGTAVGLPADIGEELAGLRPGDRVEVVVDRSDSGGDDRVTLDVELRESPDDPGRPVLGIQAEPANPVVRSEVNVEVDSGTVSGPSAGLAWTLGIIDRLTPGSLTEGRRVAVTGEIREDGSVGAVGGLVQKTAAVSRDGIEVFLFPADTPEDVQAEMRRVAGDRVELHPVASVSEAVEALVPGGLLAPA